MLKVDDLMIKEAPVLGHSSKTVSSLILNAIEGKQVQPNLKKKKSHSEAAFVLLKKLLFTSQRLEINQVVALILKSLSPSSEFGTLSNASSNLFSSEQTLDDVVSLVCLRDEYLTIPAYWKAYNGFQKIVKWLEVAEVIDKDALIITKPTLSTETQFKRDVDQLIGVLRKLQKRRPNLDKAAFIKIPDFITSFYSQSLVGNLENLDFTSSTGLVTVKNRIISKHLFRTINRKLGSLEPTYRNRALHFLTALDFNEEIANSQDPLQVGLQVLRLQRKRQFNLVGYEEFLAKRKPDLLGNLYQQTNPLILTKFELEMIRLLENSKRSFELPGVDDTLSLKLLYGKLDQICLLMAEYVDHYTMNGKFEDLVYWFKRPSSDDESFPDLFTELDGGRGLTIVYNSLVSRAYEFLDRINTHEKLDMAPLRKFLPLDVLKQFNAYDVDAFKEDELPGWFNYLRDRGHTEKYRCLQINPVGSESLRAYEEKMLQRHLELLEKQHEQMSANWFSK